MMIIEGNSILFVASKTLLAVNGEVKTVDEKTINIAPNAFNLVKKGEGSNIKYGISIITKIERLNINLSGTTAPKNIFQVILIHGYCSNCYNINSKRSEKHEV